MRIKNFEKFKVIAIKNNKMSIDKLSYTSPLDEESIAEYDKKLIMKY